jgi:hypothetical protein
MPFDPPHPPPSASVDRRALAGVLDHTDASLVDVVDSLLSKGVVLDGEVVLALADVDLIYLRLSVLLVAADRVLGRA